jgi:hypothetical protein
MRTLTILLLLVLVPATNAGVYGLRIGPDNNRVRWLTNIDAEQGVEFEVEDGLVSVFKSTERPNELVIVCSGKGEPADIVVKTCCANYARLRIEKPAK